MRTVILGAGGFLGSRLLRYLQQNDSDVIGYGRADIDFTMPSTFKNYQPKPGDVIVDCVARIDGSEADIEEVNVSGLEQFIKYIKQYNVPFRYIYFSTYSTQLATLVKSNAYIRSKYKAELYIRDQVTDYQIIRLVFLFGKGENKNRLISRMIGKIKTGEPLTIDKLTLNLTTSADILEHFDDMLKYPSREINFSNNIEFYFPDVVQFMAECMGQKADVLISDKELNLTFPSTVPVRASREGILNEIAEMVYEQ